MRARGLVSSLASLEKVLVLQCKPQERVGALALELKLATHAVLDCDPPSQCITAAAATWARAQSGLRAGTAPAGKPIELANRGTETHSRARPHVEPHGPVCSILYVLCPRAYIGLTQVFNDFRHCLSGRPDARTMAKRIYDVFDC